MLSYEYINFLNDKIIGYLPKNRVCVGDKINFKCPICGDSKKSKNKKRGFWYRKTASYYCFNCGVGMSGIKFLKFLSGEDYDDVKKEYTRLFLKSGLDSGLSSVWAKPDDEPGLFDLKPAVKPEWKKPLSDDAKKYLDGRLVTSAPFFADDLRSCYCANGAEYVLIPWTVNGVEAYYQLNDFKKNGPVKYVFPKDRKKLVYGLDNVDLAWPYVIIFEGVYDSLFVKNALAVGSKTITDYQLNLIKKRYPNHRICVSFDNDEPGLTATSKLIENGNDFLFLKWFNSDTKEKDVNDFVVSKKDVGTFSDQKLLESMILTSLQMKMWLIQNGKWPVAEKPKRAFSRKYRK